MMHQMKKSRFKKPYLKNGKTAFRHISGKAGVYLIKSIKTGKILYVGHSKTDLYKTMYRHFQEWNDNTQVRTTFANKNAYTVRVVLTTPARAARLEKGLIAN